MMPNFHAIELPQTLATAVRRTTGFRTEIVETGSGFEFRNATHATARRRYELDTGPRPLTEMRQLAAFFEARRGRQYGFLLRDWLTPHSGTAIAPQADDRPLLRLDDKRFALRLDMDAAARQIILPVADTLLVAQDGRLLEAEKDYRLDATQGVIETTMTIAHDAVMMAGFYYYVAVRFDADAVEMTRLSAELAGMTPLPLVEIALLRDTQ